MDKQRQEMNKKYVEMHLMVNKYLIEPEQDISSFGGTQANLFKLLNESNDPDAHAPGSTEDLTKQLEQVKKDMKARIANMPRIDDVFSQKRTPKLPVYSNVVGMIPTEAWNRSREIH